MSKTKKSAPAIFMYCIIAVTLAVSVICFIFYYGNFFKNTTLLWCGITAFTIMYHLWLRIIWGNITKLFKIHYRQFWFKERFFEKKFYKFLRVKKWKDKALTYNPEAFSLKKHSLDEIAITMAKSETDHWINELISLSVLLFSFIWGQLWIFLITSLLAMIFDAQFIIIQRYNRPKVLKIMQKQSLYDLAIH